MLLEKKTGSLSSRHAGTRGFEAQVDRLMDLAQYQVVFL
jgi:hypothetical protein